MYVFYIVWFSVLVFIIFDDTVGCVWDKIKMFFSLSFVLTLVVFVIVGLITMLTINETYEYRDVRIESLTIKDNFDFGGSFILGTGSISGSGGETYIVHVRYPQGVKRVHINTNNAFIRETNREQPHIKDFEYRRISPEVTSNWLLKREERVSGWRRNDRNRNMVIVVPENTIIYRFNVE